MNYLKVLETLLNELQFKNIIEDVDWSYGEDMEELNIITKNAEIISIKYDIEGIKNIEYSLLEK